MRDDVISKQARLLFSRRGRDPVTTDEIVCEAIALQAQQLRQWSAFRCLEVSVYMRGVEPELLIQEVSWLRSQAIDCDGGLNDG